jgi:hypothetical protein
MGTKLHSITLQKEVIFELNITQTVEVFYTDTLIKVENINHRERWDTSNSSVINYLQIYC